jgi:hypothetical protein
MDGITPERTRKFVSNWFTATSLVKNSRGMISDTRKRMEITNKDSCFCLRAKPWLIYWISVLFRLSPIGNRYDLKALRPLFLTFSLWMDVTPWMKSTIKMFSFWIAQIMFRFRTNWKDIHQISEVHIYHRPRVCFGKDLNIWMARFWHIC